MSRAPRIVLDFIPRRWRPGASGWLVLLGGLLFAAWVVSDFLKQNLALQIESHNLARLNRVSDQRRLQQLAAQRETIPDAEIARANAVARTLSRPWAGLFAALDKVADPQIVLTRFEPNGPKGAVQLDGEARSLHELFDYARRLGRQPGIREARVDSYSFKDAGAAHSVSFSLTARWGNEP